jgi:hypothetical protein
MRSEAKDETDMDDLSELCSRYCQHLWFITFFCYIWAFIGFIVTLYSGVALANVSKIDNGTCTKGLDAYCLCRVSR